MAATGKQTSKVHRLRKRLAAGQPVTDIERAWLRRYEAQHAPRRPILVLVRKPMEGAGDNVPSESHPSTPPLTASEPEPAAKPAAPGGGPPPIVVPDTPGEAAAKEDQASAATAAADELDAAKRKRARERAEKYGAWLKFGNAEIAARGGIPIPAEVIDELVVPAAADLAYKHLGEYELGETGQKLVVAGAGVVTIYQRHTLRKAAAQGQVQAAAAKPAAASQPAPAPAPAAPAATNWAGPSGLDRAF